MHIIFDMPIDYLKYNPELWNNEVAWAIMQWLFQCSNSIGCQQQHVKWTMWGQCVVIS